MVTNAPIKGMKTMMPVPRPRSRAASACPHSWMKISSTTPTPNGQPYSFAQNHMETSMEPKVSSSLPNVSSFRPMSKNFSLDSKTRIGAPILARTSRTDASAPQMPPCDFIRSSREGFCGAA